MEDMQSKYPLPIKKRVWDPVFTEYPIRKFPELDISSTSIGHKWRNQPEILSPERTGLPEEVKEYNNDTNLLLNNYKSLTTLDYSFKHPEPFRINKHTSCVENEFIYPTTKQLEHRIPSTTAHATTEMRSAYQQPVKPATLATDKEQYKRINNISIHPIPEPYYNEELPPLDTTYEGFEKYLDPYLTTSRLHHRPFTADQLNRPSASSDIVTYHTLSEEPWVRRPKVKSDIWALPLCSKAKPFYDREKFKFQFREIRCHNKISPVPGTFRTEVRNNYVNPNNQTSSQIRLDQFDDVKNNYHRQLATMNSNEMLEDLVIRKNYVSEYDHMTSGRKLCTVVNQYREKNKRLQAREDMKR